MVHLVLALLVGGLHLEGQTTCPSVDDVARVLRTLPEDGEGTYVARLRTENEQLVVELEDGAGRSLRTRRLPMTGACADLASAAAVIIAAWVGELRAFPADAVALRRRPRPAGVRWDLSAGFTAGLVGARFSPGATVELQLGPRTSRFGGRLALVGEAPRSLAFDGGEARFVRPMVQLGPDVRFWRWRLLFDLHPELSLSPLFVEGTGFSSSHHAFDLDVGLGGGARAAIRVGPVAPFIGVGIVGWLRREQVQVTGISARGTLPRYEVLLTAGIAIGRFR